MECPINVVGDTLGTHFLTKALQFKLSCMILKMVRILCPNIVLPVGTFLMPDLVYQLLPRPLKS